MELGFKPDSAGLHMNAQTHTPEALDLRFVAKAIGDLDALVRAVLTSLPTSKPWQRQLRAQLSEADRLIEVLRLVVAMDRGEQEVAQAGRELLTAMRAAYSYVNAGRADVSTRAALLLGFNLAEKIAASLGE
ncbi:hypothetical protein [Roseateles flavus]|uniref:Uncharacterized protein n=1 Tax=Roseateles flavus TaxID=3149041 RepID=A0ABV0G8W8_9BURK